MCTRLTEAVSHVQVYVPIPDVGSLTQLLSTPPHSDDFALTSSELVYLPNDPLEVTDDGMGITEETAEAISNTADILEDEGDVVKVWTNLA
jgi:transcriptional/translational regulatory protein YebC/TACO1